MKKTHCFALALLAAIALAGCGENKESLPSASSAPAPATSQTPESVPSEVPSSPSLPSSEPVMDIVGFGGALAETPYASSSLAGKTGFGLSNPELVGVLEEKITYAGEKEDGEYEAGRLISYEDITLEDAKEFFDIDELDDYHAAYTCFKKAAALSDGEKPIKIKFPRKTLTFEGRYFEANRAFELTGLQKVDIVGDDTVFKMAYQGLDWKGVFTLSSCKDVTISGIAITSEVPSTLTGTITAMDVEKKTSTVKVDPVFHPLVKRLLENKGELCEYLEFDVRTKIPLLGGNFFDRGAFSDYKISGDENEGYSIEVDFIPGISRSRNGSYVVLAFSEYDVSSVAIGQCENIVLEDFKLHHSPGMGIVASQSKNLILNRVSIALEEESHSLMTATADGLHFNEMHGEVKVLNSLIEYTHDDALNIKHGYWYKVASADNASKSLSLTKMTGEVSAPEVGQKVIVYNEDTFEAHNPTAGAYTITAVEKTASGYDLTVKERMSGVNDWGNCRASLLTDTPEFVFKNNIVRNKRNRGILVQVPDAIVENNTFQNIGHGSLQAASALDQFNECTLPQRLLVRNNKFIGNIFLQPEPLYGDVSVFALSKEAAVAPKSTLKGIKIENNFFTANGNSAICFRGVGDSSIEGNLFYECCKYQISGEQNNSLFNGYNIATIEMKDNYSHYTLGKGMNGIFLQGLATESDVTLTNNVGIDFYRSKEVGPDVDVAKASTSLSFDGDLSDWEGSGANDIEFIAASLATGDPISLEETKDVFRIEKAMIASTDEGIAMAFDVFDNQRDVKPAASFWTGDCIEILATTLLDMPSADMQVYKNDGGVLQAAFAPTWTASNYASIASARSNAKYLGKEKELKVGCSADATSYSIEFLLPYAVFPEFKEAVEKGDRIGIAIVVADSEREELGRKRVQAGNVPHFVENYKTKSEMMPRYKFSQQ